jgi:biopolymer transport protein ExbD
MASRFRKRLQGKTEFSQELELMPMLNVFISIIPLLLLSAAFVQLAVIPTTLPTPAVPQVVVPGADVKVALTIMIHPDAFVVQANGVTTSTIERPVTLSRDDAGSVAVRAQLEQALRAVAGDDQKKREVRIVADPTTRYEDLIDVMDVSRAAGLPEAGLADGS